MLADEVGSCPAAAPPPPDRQQGNPVFCLPQAWWDRRREQRKLASTAGEGAAVLQQTRMPLHCKHKFLLLLIETVTSSSIMLTIFCEWALPAGPASPPARTPPSLPPCPALPCPWEDPLPRQPAASTARLPGAASSSQRGQELPGGQSRSIQGICCLPPPPCPAPASAPPPWGPWPGLCT